MKGKSKILIVVLVILVLMLVGVIGSVAILKNDVNDNDTTKEENKDKDSDTVAEDFIYNNREKVVEDKVSSGISFTNINCYYDGKNTIISYTITNTTDSAIMIEGYKIIAKDEFGEPVKTINPYLGRELAPHEEYDDVISSTADFSNAYSFDIVLE